MIIILSMVIGSPFLGVPPPDHKDEGIFFLFWAIFTRFMFLGTIKNGHITLKLIFFTLAIKFLILSISAITKSGVVTEDGGGF